MASPAPAKSFAPKDAIPYVPREALKDGYVMAPHWMPKRLRCIYGPGVEGWIILNVWDETVGWQREWMRIEVAQFEEWCNTDDRVVRAALEKLSRPGGGLLRREDPLDRRHYQYKVDVKAVLARDARPPRKLDRVAEPVAVGGKSDRVTLRSGELQPMSLTQPVADIEFRCSGGIMADLTSKLCRDRDGGRVILQLRLAPAKVASEDTGTPPPLSDCEFSGEKWEAFLGWVEPVHRRYWHQEIEHGIAKATFEALGPASVGHLDRAAAPRLARLSKNDTPKLLVILAGKAAEVARKEPPPLDYYDQHNAGTSWGMIRAELRKRMSAEAWRASVYSTLHFGVSHGTITVSCEKPAAAEAHAALIEAVRRELGVEGALRFVSIDDLFGQAETERVA